MNREKEKQIHRSMKTLVKKDPRFNINEVRIIVALERAIARLSQSKDLAGHLVFKGGFVLLKSYESLRFTRDADALAMAISKDKLKDLVCKALESYLNDGLWFGDVKVQELTEQGEYGAYRFNFAFQVGEPDLKKIHKLSRVHIDVNFSDKLPTKPQNQRMPSILEYEVPITWKIYPIEYIVAEKIQTFFDRGSTNSRAKDIYDLIYLFPNCQNQHELMQAIENTFKNRGSILPESFVTEATKLDITFLTHAWPGVRILENKLEFNETWKLLIEFFRKIDLMRTGK